MERAVDAPRHTRASEALKERFKNKRSGVQKACAKKTGIEQSRLSKIANGKAFPRADEAAWLAQEGIPVEWWTEEYPAAPAPDLDPEEDDEAPDSEQKPTGAKEAS